MLYFVYVVRRTTRPQQPRGPVVALAEPKTPMKGAHGNYDSEFPPKEKAYQCSQEIFAIAVRPFLR